MPSIGCRREFTPRAPGGSPYSAMSVLGCRWRRGDRWVRGGLGADHPELPPRKREPLPPEEVSDFARSEEFCSRRHDGGQMVTGEPKAVAARLLDMRQRARPAGVRHFYSGPGRRPRV